MEAMLQQGQNTLDLSGLSSGIYFLRVPGKQAMKLMIQK
jgi:hypothetical protein